MGIYDDILRNAPGQDHVAAGHLHEQLWETLLRRESPDLHNVRLGRGDGGIDGVEFMDPVLNTAHIYQAKFFSKLDEDHRPAVLNSFVTAHKHTFPCTRWTLLVPFEPSAPELNWLTVGMRTEALTQLTDATHNARAAACEIRYKDSTDLEDLLKRNLPIAAQLLPDSVLALQDAIRAEREKSSNIDREVAARVRELHDSLIREREAQRRRALSAAAMLNQGWANHLFTFQRLLVPADDAETHTAAIEAAAEQLVTFAETRMRDAYHADGLGVGLAELVSRIHNIGRKLHAVARPGLFQAATTPASYTNMMRAIVDDIKTLQQQLATILQHYPTR